MGVFDHFKSILGEVVGGVGRRKLGYDPRFPGGDPRNAARTPPFVPEEGGMVPPSDYILPAHREGGMYSQRGPNPQIPTVEQAANEAMQRRLIEPPRPSGRDMAFKYGRDDVNTNIADSQLIAPVKAPETAPIPSLASETRGTADSSQGLVVQEAADTAPPAPIISAVSPSDTTNLASRPRIVSQPSATTVSTAGAPTTQQQSKTAPPSTPPYVMDGERVVSTATGEVVDMTPEMAAAENARAARVITPVAPAAPKGPQPTLSFKTTPVAVRGNREVVDANGNVVADLATALKDPTFRRDYLLQELDKEEQAALANGTYDEVTRTRINKRRAQVNLEFQKNRPPDTKRGVKDFLKGLGLGALQAFATAPAGASVKEMLVRSASGALTGGVGTLINPDVDERLADKMFNLPKLEQQLQDATAAETSALEAEKAERAAIKAELDNIKLRNEVAQQPTEAATKNATARQKIIETYLPPGTAATPEIVAQIDAALEAIGQEPSGIRQGQGRGGVKMRQYVEGRLVEGTYYANTGQFVPGYYFDATGKRVILEDPLEEIVDVYDEQGNYVGPMTQGEKAKRDYLSPADREKLDAQIRGEVVKENTKELRDADGAIARLTSAKTRLTGEIELYKQKIENAKSAAALAKQSFEQKINAGNPDDPNEVLPPNLWDDTHVKAKDDYDKASQKAAADIAIFQVEIDRRIAELNNVNDSLAEHVQRRDSAQKILEDRERPIAQLDQDYNAEGLTTGTYIVPNGQRYVGGMKRGADGQPTFHGKGTYSWPSGAKYEGTYVDGMMSGQGTYTFSNGRVYTGQMSNNQFNGTGKMTWPNKLVYEGTWKNDKREGEGTVTWPQGHKFTGTFKGDVATAGTITYPSNEKYVGEVKTVGEQIQLHGNGVLYNANGTEKQRGVWKDGVFTTSQTGK